MKHRVWITLLLLSALIVMIISGCGETTMKDTTGNAVAEPTKGVNEEFDKPIVSETAQQNKDKKEMCDETYDGPTRKICYRMFGVKQVIGGSIQ